MQTFLPFTDFLRSARALDNKRLVKQAIEAKQILKTVIGESRAWINHPVTRQWINYPIELNVYLAAIAYECINRGFKSIIDSVHICASTGTPKWLGNKEYHYSHRCKLKYKGRVDALCLTLKTFLKVRSINTWLKNNGFPLKNMLQYSDVVVLESLCEQNNLTIGPNHYSIFEDAVDDNSVPYWWPSQHI